MKLMVDTPIEAQKRIAQAMRDRRIALGHRQADLAARAGLSLGSLKRFEQSGAITLLSLLQIAEALDCLHSFADLFPEVEARGLDDIVAKPKRRRVRP